MSQAARPEPPGPAFHLALAVLLLAIAGAGGLDIALDAPTTWRDAHLWLEGAFLVLCLGSALYLASGWRRARRSVGDLRRALAANVDERDAWRERALALLQGLGVAIDAQLAGWRLTPTERDTALLLLKGYSHRQIAQLTGRSERTVRQHAVAVYRKSGLGGRAELSAFFLEDLLLPAAPVQEAGRPPADRPGAPA